MEGRKDSYFNDLVLLPEVRANHITFNQWLSKNNNWFRRIGFHAAHRLPSCHISSDDLMQESMSYAWLYIFGANAFSCNIEAYRLNCCGRLWPNAALYLRHRRTNHKNEVDLGFSRYVAFNVARRIRHIVREQYAKKRDVRKIVLLPGGDDEWLFNEHERTNFNVLSKMERDSLVDRDVVIDEVDILFKSLANRAVENLDDQAMFLLQRMLDGEPVYESTATSSSLKKIRRSFTFLKPESVGGIK